MQTSRREELLQRVERSEHGHPGRDDARVLLLHGGHSAFTAARNCAADWESASWRPDHHASSAASAARDVVMASVAAQNSAPVVVPTKVGAESATIGFFDSRVSYGFLADGFSYIVKNGFLLMFK